MWWRNRDWNQPFVDQSCEKRNLECGERERGEGRMKGQKKQVTSKTLSQEKEVGILASAWTVSY